MTSGEWKNFSTDLTASQRADTTKVLAGDVTERNTAISNVNKSLELAKPIRIHQQDLASLAGMISARPAEMFVDKYRLASVSSNVLASYINTGTA
jgi:hypothetical protein